MKERRNRRAAPKQPEAKSRGARPIPGRGRVGEGSLARETAFASRPATVKGRRVPGPESRDPHRLYELSVQCPEADAHFFERIFRHVRGRMPRHLREDFCGTAYLSSHWVLRHPENTALAIDLDEPTLDWAYENNVHPLGRDATRVKLIEGDVRAVTRPQAEIAAALNFSYFIFKTRSELLRYFRAARSGLARDGLLILDIFGGWEAQALTTEKKRLKGFTYLWEQAQYDPISHDVLFYIHFRFSDGKEIRRAFTYDWRFWTIAEVRELLHEAGFSSTQIYWEGTDRETGDGNGIFRETRKAKSCPGWIAYLVAF